MQALKHSLKISKDLESIADKVLHLERITDIEALLLYERAELGLLGSLANFIRQNKHGDHTFFNRNFHIEPTNKCVFTCKFCSYSRLVQQEDEAWELTEKQMLDAVRKYEGIHKHFNSIRDAVSKNEALFEVLIGRGGISLFIFNLIL